jgi:hypothetical protein
MLYQGSLREATTCARHIPNFNVIVCLSDEEEPPSIPDKVGNTSIITLGYKGRYVGVVGLYRTGDKARPFRLRYQLVSLGEEFDTPSGKEKGHPLMKLMEEYAREVKRNDYLGKAAAHKVPHPVQLTYPKSTYVGSESCKKCHQHAYKIWAKSPHAHAYATLVKAKNPSLRQYDPECIKCHVTGWNYKSGFMDEVKTSYLKNNGCENCHGPCSEHVALEQMLKRSPQQKKDRRKIRDLINPYRFDAHETPSHRNHRKLQINSMCRKCHDDDNDRSWNVVEKWFKGKMIHSDDSWKKGD